MMCRLLFAILLLAWPGFAEAQGLSGGGPGGGGGGTPGGPNGSIQFRSGNVFGGLVLGTAFNSNGTTLNLAPGAACFNLGAWTGALTGAACTAPSLSPGAAATNLGPVAGDLTGSWPSLALVPASIFSKMGTPGGDLGGSTYATPLVTGLNGVPINTAVAPTPNTSLVFDGAKYTPQTQAPGINQITGAISVGPGTGSQVATLNPGVVTNANLTTEPPNTLKCNAGSAAAPPMDCPVGGGLVFSTGALQIGPLGISTSQTIQIAAAPTFSCMTITNGVITSILSGACSTGTVNLTADDGATLLTADDGVTQLTPEGGTIQVACASNMVFKFNVATGCNMIGFLFMLPR